MDKKWRTIDLFAGIGGIRKGFEMTGRFETVFANDFDKYTKITYDRNFPDTQMTVKDITKLSIEKDLIPEFDFLLAGFPCQPFSVGGYMMGFGDPKGRGILFWQIIRLLKESNKKYGRYPMGFLLENVKNLKSHDSGRTYAKIQEELEKLGYCVEAKVLNSLDFGVPQNRERIYIVGFQNKRLLDGFEWPEPSCLRGKHKKVRDVLDSWVDEKYYYEGRPLFERIKDDVVDKDIVYQYRRTYVRAIKGGYAPTLVASMGTGGHNVPIIKDQKGLRRLTPAECGRVQGYPDLVIPEGIADCRIYKQIGNSVSVPVVHKIAQKIVASATNID